MALLLSIGLMVKNESISGAMLEKSDSCLKGD